MFRVIIILHHPSSSELHLAYSHFKMFFQDFFINMGIDFLLYNGKQSKSTGSKAAKIRMLPPPYYTVAMFSSWYAVQFNGIHSAAGILFLFHLSTRHFPCSDVECQSGLWQTFGMLQCFVCRAMTSFMVRFHGYNSCSMFYIWLTHERRC